jgi:histidinol-phosphate aminotransferase
MSLDPMAAGAPLRLHLNEFNGGCAPAVVAALRTMTAADIGHYPDDRAATAAAARSFGVDADWVCLTNGLDDGLHAVARAARAEGGEALVIEPSFDTFAVSAEAAGLRVVRVGPSADLRVAADAVLAALTPRTKLVFLNDPQNPTGLALPPTLVADVAAAAPQAVVLADEAYAEFSGRTSLGGVLAAHPNVVIGRTFAKAYGLVGLRIGALVAHPDTLRAIRWRQPIFHVNVCAVRALEAALDAPEYTAWVVAETAASREIIYDWSTRQALPFWRSDANFVLVRVGDRATDLAEALAARSVLVRDRSMTPGCAGCLRITAGLPEETRQALAALEDARASIAG